MKAKLNLTGEILDVRKHGDYYIDNDGCVMLPEDLTFIPEPDWQQIHIQTAIKLTCVLSEKMLRDGYNESQITKQAVVLSDALVEELKKKHNNANI
jgi:hypothetical protein